MTTTRNLILNGDCETDPLSDDITNVSPPGWVISGGMSAVAYAANESDSLALKSDIAAADGGGRGYFAGGPGGVDHALCTQRIDVSAFATAIDTGTLTYDLQGDLGGYASQNDSFIVSVMFLDEHDSEDPFEQPALTGPTAAQRGSITKLMHKEASGTVPAGTRTIVVSLQATRTDGAYNDGYADNISLTLSGTGLAGGVVQVATGHDYHHDTLGHLTGIQFETTASSVVATFAAEQFESGTVCTVLGDTHHDMLSILIGSSHRFDGDTLLNLRNWDHAASTVQITGSGAADYIVDTSQSDVIHCGTGNDEVHLVGPYAYADSVFGDAGNDSIVASRELIPGDKINGGGGNDGLTLQAFFAPLLMSNSTIKNIEILSLRGNRDVEITMADGNVARHKTLTVDSDFSHSLSFDGHAETNGKFVIGGSPGIDTLIGGALGDVLQGGLKGDFLTGGNGPDIYKYAAVEESTSSIHDLITGFDASSDRIDLSAMHISVNAVDPKVNGGALTDAQFDLDLKAALGKHELKAHHAVLFAPGSGDYPGETFVVVDVNGHAGYQIDADLVIALQSPAHLSAFGLTDFIT